MSENRIHILYPLISLFFVILFACSEKEPTVSTPPALTLDSIVTITGEKAVFYGNLVLAEPGSEIIEKGFLVSEETNPVLNATGVKTVKSSADSAVAYVKKYNRYFVRMYCKTSDGIYYSEEKTFQAFIKGLYFNCLGGTGEDGANQICYATDGGYIIVGSTSSTDGDVEHNFGNKDFWMVKIGDDGQIKWEETFGGNGDETATDVCPSADGGYYIAGFSNSTDNRTQTNKGGNDYWIIKTDITGQLIWQKLLGGGMDDVATSVAKTDDGGCIVAGYSSSADGDASGNHGKNDFWIIRLNASGELIWQRMIGGSLDDEAFAIKQTADGHFIIAGSSESANGDVTGTTEAKDFWVIKLDDSGEIIWRNSVGNSLDDIAYDIVQTDDGGYLAVGASFKSFNDKENTGNSDFYVARFSADGSTEWTKSYGSSAEDGAQRVIQNSSGNYIICGAATEEGYDVEKIFGNRDMWMIEISESGNLLQTKNFGGSNFEIASGMLATENGYILAGTTYSSDEHGVFNHRKGSADILVLSMDNNRSFGN
ncbi:hypothetical protein [Saccharicrinis sp. FJH54]|uniref:hypothetical protein n=1 Tax=Saccharicrinis sp. FJH54 TaxID=3344665 RepID=UPI0035D4C4F9